MKRSFSILSGGSLEGGGAGSTPRGPGSLGPVPRGSGKRPRQTTLRAFLCPSDTPTETPSHGHLAAAGSGGAKFEWPSTAQRAFQNLRVAGTPSLPTLGPQVAPHRAACGELDESEHGEGTPTWCPTVWDGAVPKGSPPHSRNSPVDPPSREDDEDDDHDAGFRILSSQTYIRPATQQDDTSSSWQDTWLPSDVHQGEPTPQAAPAPTHHGQAAGTAELAAHHDADDGLVSVMTQECDPAPQSSQQSLKRTPLPGALGFEGDGGVAPAVPTRSNQSHLAQALTPELMPVQTCDDASFGGMPGAEGAAAGPQQGGLALPHGPAPPLAALFRPRSHRKMLLVVRHGESEYNQAVQQSRSCADPMIFDPHLTQKGVAQCKKLRQQLAGLLAEKAAEFGEPLWVVSPLTRALQTFLLSCPFPERLPRAPEPPRPPPHGPASSPAGPAQNRRAQSQQAGGAGVFTRSLSAGSGPSRFATAASAATGVNFTTALRALRGGGPAAGTGVGSSFSSAGSSRSGSDLADLAWDGARGQELKEAATPGLLGVPGPAADLPTPTLNPAATQQPPAPAAPPPALKIEVLPLIAEFMATPGDVGRPPAHLINEFPQLAQQLAGLPEVWWHHSPSIVSCAITRRWEGMEPRERRKHRVAEFSRWLSGRQERLFVLVGHSCFWHAFTGKQYSHMRNCEVLCLTW